MLLTLWIKKQLQPFERAACVKTNKICCGKSTISHNSQLLNITPFLGWVFSYSHKLTYPSCKDISCFPTFNSSRPTALLCKCFVPLSGVTILLSLTVFSQVVAETMPATSDAVPLLGNPMKHYNPKDILCYRWH